jgi:hypothetical protein
MDVVSDGSHLNKREIDLFPFNPALEKSPAERLSILAELLSIDLKANSFERTMSYKHDTLTVQCIVPKLSKKLIDSIDIVLGQHYGFTPTELDYIINYDIKYRMGQGLEEDGDD